MNFVVSVRLVSVVVWALLAAGCGSSQPSRTDAAQIDTMADVSSNADDRASGNGGSSGSSGAGGNATSTGGSTTSGSGGVAGSGGAGGSAVGGTGQGEARDAGTGGSVNEGLDASADADNRDGGGSASDADPIKLWGLSAGENCFSIASIEPGSSDGCNFGVAGFVGLSMPMTYTFTSATVALGVNGSLGTGEVRSNKGTLLSNRDTSDTSGNVVCKFHQNVTTQFELIADNKFIARVTEVDSMFGANCGSLTPMGGTCTSTWTWTMQRSKDTSLFPPNCGNF